MVLNSRRKQVVRARVHRAKKAVGGFKSRSELRSAIKTARKQTAQKIKGLKPRKLNRAAKRSKVVVKQRAASTKAAVQATKHRQKVFKRVASQKAKAVKSKAAAARGAAWEKYRSGRDKIIQTGYAIHQAGRLASAPGRLFPGGRVKPVFGVAGR